MDQEIERALTEQVEPRYQLLVKNRLGWLGCQVHTLEAIAQDPALSGLRKEKTRERIRQIERQSRQDIKAAWKDQPPPAILRTLKLLKDSCPITEANLGKLLEQEGLTKHTLSFKTLRVLADLASFPWRFCKIYQDEQIVASTSVHSEEDNMFLAKSIKKATNYRPLSSVDDVMERTDGQFKENYIKAVISAHSRLFWLDKEHNCFWLKPDAPVKKNRIIFICGKIFTIEREASLAELHELITRTRKIREKFSTEALSNLLRLSGLFDVKGDRVSRRDGVTFDNLRRQDRLILQAAKIQGRTFQFVQMRDHLMSGGMSDPSATALIITSPLLKRIGKGRYQVVVDPALVKAKLLADRE